MQMPMLISGRAPRSFVRRRKAIVVAAFAVAMVLLLPGCSSTPTGENGADLVTRDQMTDRLTAAAKDAITATGITLTYANLTYISCADDNVSSPSYVTLNAGFPIADTPEQAQAQVDAWATKLVAAGWIQTPLSTSQEVKVQDRILFKDGLGLFLTPWAKNMSRPPNVFTVRADCIVDTEGRPEPEDDDVLPRILG
jgi:hypothetical protein